MGAPEVWLALVRPRLWPTSLGLLPKALFIKEQAQGLFVRHPHELVGPLCSTLFLVILGLCQDSTCGEGIKILQIPILHP